MNQDSSVAPPSFDVAARLIAGTDGDAEWLASGVRNWIWPQERWPSSLRKSGSELGMFAALANMQWLRVDLVKKLSDEVPQAVNTLSELLANWPLMKFLDGERLGPGFGPHEQVILAQLLFELRRRCAEVTRFPELLSDGKPNPGRSRALAPGQVDAKAVCASTVVVAWKFIHGKPPGPRTGQAAQAAEHLFALGAAPAGRFDLVRWRATDAEDPLKFWSRYFKIALAPNPVLERLNDMFVDLLVAARISHRRAAEL